MFITHAGSVITNKWNHWDLKWNFHFLWTMYKLTMNSTNQQTSWSLARSPKDIRAASSGLTVSVSINCQYNGVVFWLSLRRWKPWQLARSETIYTKTVMRQRLWQWTLTSHEQAFFPGTYLFIVLTTNLWTRKRNIRTMRTHSRTDAKRIERCVILFRMERARLYCWSLCLFLSNCLAAFAG